MLGREGRGGGFAFSRKFVLAQAFASFLGLTAQVAGVSAEQLLLDLAPRLDVVRARAGRTAEAPELQFEEVARRGTGAEPRTLLSAGGEEEATFLAVLPAFDEEAYGGEPRLAMQPALGLPVAVAGGAIRVEGALAPLAARPAPPGPGVRPVAPGGHVSRRLWVAEQLSRGRTILAARVLDNVQPMQTLAAGELGWLLLGDRPDASGARVGTSFGPGFIGTDQISGKPAQHSVLSRCWWAYRGI